MSQAPRKKRRRAVPKNITEKTDREIMTTLFGKRVMKEVDLVLEEQDKKRSKRVMDVS